MYQETGSALPETEQFLCTGKQTDLPGTELYLYTRKMNQSSLRLSSVWVPEN